MVTRDRYEPIELGARDEGAVALRVAGDGAAFFSPRPPAGVTRLSEHQRSDLADLQEHALMLEGMQRHLDELVAAARDSGVSWSLIGWSLGLTPEGARKRWGTGA